MAISCLFSFLFFSFTLVAAAMMLCSVLGDTGPPPAFAACCLPAPATLPLLAPVYMLPAPAAEVGAEVGVSMDAPAPAAAAAAASTAVAPVVLLSAAASESLICCTKCALCWPRRRTESSRQLTVACSINSGTEACAKG